MFTEETEKSSGSLSFLAGKHTDVANSAATSSVTTPQTGPIKSACKSIKNRSLGQEKVPTQSSAVPD